MTVTEVRSPAAAAPRRKTRPHPFLAHLLPLLVSAFLIVPIVFVF